MKARGLAELAVRMSGSTFSFSPAERHLNIAHRKLCFLEIAEVRQIIEDGRKNYDMNEWHFQKAMPQFIERAWYGFYGHLQAVETQLREMPDDNTRTKTFEFFARKPRSSWSYLGLLDEAFEAACWTSERDDPSMLQILARRGLVETLRLLLGSSEHSSANETLQRPGQFQGVSFDDQDLLGYTPMCDAAAYGSLKVVNYLLDLGADATHATLDGRTPLHLAAANGWMETVQRLLQCAKVDGTLRDAGGATPFFDAVTHAHLDVVKLLLRHECSAVHSRDASAHASVMSLTPFFHQRNFVVKYIKRVNQAVTPLFVAWFGGSPEMVDLLLHSQGIDGSYLDEKGHALLHLLCLAGPNKEELVIHSLELYKRYEKSKLIIDSGHFDTNMKNSAGFAPLHSAVMAGNRQMAKLLADLDATDVNQFEEASEVGLSPLAMTLYLEQQDIFDLLLNVERVDVNAGLSNGITPLQLAIISDQSQNVRALLRFPEVDLRVQYNNGASLLEVAVDMGHLETAKALIRGGCWEMMSAFSALKVLKIARMRWRYAGRSGKHKRARLLRMLLVKSRSGGIAPVPQTGL